MTTPADKVCSRCSQAKSAAAFYAAKDRADGLSTQCRACTSARQRERRVQVRDMLPVEVDPRRLFYSAVESANICGRSERWVYRQIDAAVFVAPERGRGVPLRITARSLHAYLESSGAL